MRLFEDSEKMIRLYQSMDKVRNRYGNKAIQRAVTMGVGSLSSNFNPFNGVTNSYQLAVNSIKMKKVVTLKFLIHNSSFPLIFNLSLIINHF